MQKIYVIEDDENIRELVRVTLIGFQYEVETFENAEDALDRMRESRPDLAIFDLMLPGTDGLEAIRRIRMEDKILPIIVLTAKDKEYDKVKVLDGGADDYVTKPFGVLELAARVRSQLRKAEAAAGSVEEPEKIDTGELVIDTAGREVSIGKEKIALTYKEYELLLYLVKNSERVVPREELLRRLWNYTVDVETRTLDIHVRTLRQKLGKKCGAYIHTIRRVGYRFSLSESEEA